MGGIRKCGCAEGEKLAISLMRDDAYGDASPIRLTVPVVLGSLRAGQ